MDCGRRPHLPEIGVQSDAPLQKRRFAKLSFKSAIALGLSGLLFTVRYLGHPLTSTENFYGDRLCGTPPSGHLNARGVVIYSDF